LLYWLYRVIGSAVFFLFYPFFLLIIRFQSHGGPRLRQRMGWIPPFGPPEKGSARVWIHAASVGEVGAASVLIRELAAAGAAVDCVVSAMTVDGQRIAGKQLPENVRCILAPLDVPWVVRRMINAIRPDIYACLETELWPALLGELRKAGVRSVLLNGRMTEHSYRRYVLGRGLFGRLLIGFSEIAVIRGEDRERLSRLGVDRSRIQVSGNMKYDFPPEDTAAVRRQYRSRLGVDGEDVFICGSTRSGEEKILVGVYRELILRGNTKPVWVIAPRHLKRVPEVLALLAECGLRCDLYTELDGRGRKYDIVVVDCLGELSRLYSAGDYNFVGGSLVNRGGHNIMEAARWGRPVYYGPGMKDFNDAAELLEQYGAGFRVADGADLAARIVEHAADRAGYEQTCRNAARAVATQRGAARKQASIILRLLEHQ
jgi:3-deoxy-D-manno-octulosonic-acid transferase